MLIRLFFLLFALFNALQASAQHLEAPKTYGAIDSWSYDAPTHQLSLRGWSLGRSEGLQPPKLILKIGNHAYESAEFDLKWAQRTDIPSHSPVTGGQQGLGFEWHVRLNEKLQPGVHPVNLVAVLANGHLATIKGAFTDSPAVVVHEIKRRHWRMLVLVLLGIAAIAYARRRLRGPRSFRYHNCLSGHRLEWGVCAAFVLLVALGVTGSSMGVLFDTAYGKSILDVQNVSRSILGDEGVRGDEWGVQLPNLLAQLHHKPRFPVVNELLGEGGQNMGVIGMTGVPVQQWAALARPATWGYFVLPLRQAMAWHWQLSFWGCLVALWWMLTVLRPAQRGLNFALSLAFCAAPYAAAWSNWPLYVTLFPAFAFVVTTQILQDRRIWRGLVLGAVLGWLLACWCLVLYPAWIIVVGSVMALVGLGWCIDNRQNLRFGLSQAGALAICVLVLGALLGSWWLDTKEAIALMQATQYPGARGAMPGGDLEWWWHLRGYHGVESMRTTGPMSNPSEASSYVIAPLLLLAVLGLAFFRDTRTRWTLLGCALFLAYCWTYAMVGFPIEVATITLWGNVPVTRMDIGFGLLTVVLLCLFAASAKAPLSWHARTFAGAVTLLSACLAMLALLRTPSIFVLNVASPVLILSMAIAVAFFCGWVLWGRMGSAVALLLWVYLLATYQFNPLRIAPAGIDLAQGHLRFAMDADRPQRTLVVDGDGIGAMVFAAVGIPVANGVFYYPHRAMWDRMGLTTKEWSQVNRYQHLGFYLLDDVDESRGYRIVLASVDQLHVHVDPQRFDFSCTGALRVTAPAQRADLLALNPGLNRLGTYQGVVWFAVHPSCPAVPQNGT